MEYVNERTAQLKETSLRTSPLSTRQACDCDEEIALVVVRQAESLQYNTICCSAPLSPYPLQCRYRCLLSWGTTASLAAVAIYSYNAPLLRPANDHLRQLRPAGAHQRGLNLHATVSFSIFFAAGSI